MDLICAWLTKVVCAALLAAAADGLMPKGPVKKVGMLACAIVLLCVLLQPVVDWSISKPEIAIGTLREHNRIQQEQLKQDSGAIIKKHIEQQLETYILDKAAGLVAVCQVDVVCQQQDEAWLPQAVYITGTLTETQREKLTNAIQEELGIPPECQVYTGGE